MPLPPGASPMPQIVADPPDFPCYFPVIETGI
jgi:hypothetical protein